jgi:cobalt-zinc-cadmium efflux system protein
MLTDAGALGLSLLAARFVARPATPGKSYGYYRMEVLAAFLNGVTLVFISLYIFYEAFHRLQEPPEVKSLPMLLIALLGLVVNLLGAWLLSRAEGGLNVRGAFLHVVGDALGSLGAVLAGVLMLAFGWWLADPLVSVGIGLLIIYGGGRFLRETVNVLMEGTPAHIDLVAMGRRLTEIPGVASVHDLHAWSVTSDFEAMSGHVVVAEEVEPRKRQELLARLCSLVSQEFGIDHVTIQLESEEMVNQGHFSCRCPANDEALRCFAQGLEADGERRENSDGECEKSV